MKLRYSPRAAEDLNEISAYIREHNPAAATRVRAALLHALRVIGSHPRAGRLQTNGVRKYALSHYPYLIFYQVDPIARELAIVTIRHAARETPSGP